MEKLHTIHRLLIVLMAMGSACCSSKAQETVGVETEEAVEIVYLQFEKWKNNETSFFELLADDAVWTVSGKSPVSGKYSGKADFLKRAVQPIIAKLKTPLKPELINLTADGANVWLHFKASATTKSDAVYENTYLWKMQLKNGKIISCIAFLDTYELTNLMTDKINKMTKTIEETQDYIGMWVTADGKIRHELLPGNRYDEARGNRKSAYQGSYKVTGNHIDYKDDTGFTADGEFKDGILYHAGMILYKENK
ncbi:Atu4866 domain-containing protein [Sphingobacterium haloxyli]|nr:Atu4866 domain-containing protein [Sphingobacterium haloxyli]